MENNCFKADPDGKHFMPSENLSTTREQILSLDIWKEMQAASEKVNSAIKAVHCPESLSKILDSLVPPGTTAAPKKSDWTISIDFTTDFGNGQGVESGMKALRQFAERTKDKNVTIVAQTSVKSELKDGTDKGNNDKGSNGYTVHRYLVKDGQVKDLGTKPSAGYGADLQDLLAYTTKNEPGKRTGLILDSHGSGNKGLTGDTGSVSVDEFVKAVKEGIKGSGHEKLDMLDFDACLMAQNGAMSRIRAVSDNIVASAQTESIFNGQNYLEPIARIFDKPDTDGFALARDIVSQTHKDMEDWEKEGKKPAIETLSHFNMTSYDEFSKSLDKFGEKLITSINDADNKEAIEAAIDSSKKYGSSGGGWLFFGGGSVERHRTDLKEFTECVIRAIDNGEIKDADRSLKLAAQEVMNKRSALVDSYHGNGEYTQAGGISVFLPGRTLRDPQREAGMRTTAGRMCEMTEPKHFKEICKDDKSREAFLKKLDSEISKTQASGGATNFFGFTIKIAESGVPGVEKELKAVEQLKDEFRKIKDSKGSEECLKKLHQAVIDLAKTEPFIKKYDQELAGLRESLPKEYKANLVDDNGGWSKFRFKLRDGK